VLAGGPGNYSRHAHRGPVRLVLQVPGEVEPADSNRKRSRMGDGVMGGQPRIPCLMVPPADHNNLPTAADEVECGNKTPSTKSAPSRNRGMLRKQDSGHHSHHYPADRRASKTLPRGFSLSGYRAAAAAAEEDEEDEEANAESVLQLYGELVNVRDYDCAGIGPDYGRGRSNGGGGGGETQNGESGSGQPHRHSSDPDLAAIPYRVSTLDRRISMKLQRARSLDLSSWSLGSRTSSWTTSSSSGMHKHICMLFSVCCTFFRKHFIKDL
jgi:Rho guanine nucleotide exchange factor 10